MAYTQRVRRGLVHELQRSLVLTLWVLGGMLVLSLVSSGFLIASQRASNHDTEVVRTARDAREAMIDQETGLRGWLATGNEVFLDPYRTGRTSADEAFAKLRRDVDGTPELTTDVVDLLLARERWDTWATEASGMRVGSGESDRVLLSAFLLRGKNIFDAYRAADATTVSALQARRVKAMHEQVIALAVVATGYVVVLGGALVIALRRRRSLRRSVLEPVDRLLATIALLRSGDLDARTTPSGVPELDQIGTEVGRLARDLQQAGTEATAREARLVRLASQLETVVTVSREISGSLSVRYVARAVTTAAADLLGTPATLWVRDASQQFTVADRSDDAHGTIPPAGLKPPVAMAAAAADASRTELAGRVGHPLVLAGTVVAVLDTAPADVDQDTAQVLTALLATAAAALESAHLHSAARELADMDGLTHLANRRRFEVDVDAEWERCRRYGRPMSIVMLDLDHFKDINDEHGHLVGDEVLRAAANALTEATRTTDTAYRYGGEEFVVLLRETGLEDATTLAERLRTAVAGVQVVGGPVSVTTSAGVASRQVSMSHHTELIAVADRALYAAKRAGRNQVVADSQPSSGADPADPAEPATSTEAAVLSEVTR